MGDSSPRPDPYEVLGIGRDASSAEISRAYRRLARELHPDSRPADAAAADRFRAVTAAHELLSGVARRAAHDQQAGHSPAGPARQATPGTPSGRAAAQLRPLGQAGVPGGVLPAPAGGAVRAGPVHIEPLPGRTVTPQQDAAVWLAELLQRISWQARDGRHWAW